MSQERRDSRRLFRALTSKRVSRNKYFGRFSDGWFRAVHRRYRIVASLKTEARRLAEIPDSNCWVAPGEEGLVFHLRSPRLNYARQVYLQHHEWEWLTEQEEIQRLLLVEPQPTLTYG